MYCNHSNGNHVKICGVTSAADAESAIEYGACMIGIIFVDSSPRRVSMETAKQIVSACSNKACSVAVLVNPSFQQCRALQAEIGFDWIQLHGSEDPTLCAELHSCIKALPLRDSRLPANLAEYARACQFVLFDKPKGSQAHEWLQNTVEALVEAPFLPPFMFAGGLSPLSVGRVVKTLRRRAEFLGVDVASGVEQAPGVKDQEKLRSFFHSLRGTISNEA